MDKLSSAVRLHGRCEVVLLGREHVTEKRRAA